jgi:primosomal protein N' (replication factor Y)
MYYLEVLVAGAAYHGNEALTYSSEELLAEGDIVVVPLRKQQALGIVARRVSRPDFAVKTIVSKPHLPALPPRTLDLMHWMKSYYPSPSGVITQLFLPKELPKKAIEPQAATPQPYPPMPPLTKDQATAVTAMSQPGSYLLHGATGTGKTRAYIELARQSIETNKSVLILTPEIGLTPQLAEDFSSAFGDKVVVIHSQLTDVTRQRLWVSLLTSREPVIVIGARSALFAPLPAIGLIVVDEAHETAYKQDQAPYYHASRVASRLAQLHNATLILGSATPLVTDYFMAKVKERPILRMTEIAKGDTAYEKEVKVIDLRDRTKFTKKPYLSDELIESIRDTLNRKEQVLLFLNRRGTARVVFCEQCGWQAACPHCDLPLVYHGDTHTIRCHSCDYRATSPASCPICHNASVVFKSIGTKAIVDDIARLFPEARTMRFDTDNKKSERIEQHYPAIRNGEVDIIIGTQTLAKGLDLPKLGLVGIIIADTSLYFPDFSAQERTFQLLSQVLGRVGRGHRTGKVVLQTYAPESSLLKAILSKNWPVFYEGELAERKTFLFPPFCYLLKLTCRRVSQQSAQQASEKLAKSLSTALLRIRIEGPAPAFHEKVQNKYQWQLIVKAKDRGELLKVISLLPSGWVYDIDPMNLL